jgi:hypothetical protein
VLNDVRLRLGELNGALFVAQQLIWLNGICVEEFVHLSWYRLRMTSFEWECCIRLARHCRQPLVQMKRQWLYFSLWSRRGRWQVSFPVPIRRRSLRSQFAVRWSLASIQYTFSGRIGILLHCLAMTQFVWRLR